jgi:hypothetical protein
VVPRPSDPKREEIGEVVVSDLTLRKSRPHGSFLQRFTDIRFVGKKKKMNPPKIPCLDDTDFKKERVEILINFNAFHIRAILS